MEKHGDMGAACASECRGMLRRLEAVSATLTRPGGEPFEVPLSAEETAELRSLGYAQ